MNLSLEHKEELLTCIHQVLPHAQIFAYGSRVRENSKPNSDLDILIRTKSVISQLELSDIKEKLSISNLPFFVDIQDYFCVNAEFLDSIKKDLILL